MDLKPIKTEADYRQALAEVEKLFDAGLNTPAGNKLEILVTLIEAYEEKYYPIDLPLPHEAILYHIESRHQPISSFIEGLKRRGVSEEVIHAALKEVE
ncbi:MAG: transcriptional regulator [Jaaginema sp. PMC 1079.18]|nr:transcriptional regulator [Jaaginema sp. PMC 1080.18]MEC4851963.1 transcriptional regulator [Jaaginema sp. PMC 1079.18]MEC4868471.1 transcriptional regulator [Jaaginema sp. PMC 1078.18]